MIRNASWSESVLKRWHCRTRSMVSRLSEILRNPFYCGYLSHNLLEGQVIKGNHEALITEETFLQANEMLKKNAQGYKQENRNANIPLKNFVRCAECGTPFTGYIVKAKNLYYYKCNRIGCKCNRSAKGMHSLYADFLKSYHIDQESCGLLKEQLLLTYEYLTQSEQETRVISQQKLNELQIKLNKIEERFAYGEIDRDIFEKIAGKLKEEIRFLNGDSEPARNKLSNPSEFIDQSLKICSNLSSLWVSREYDQKVQLQDLLFPGGILFDKQKENYRTEKVNSILELTHSFTQALKGNEKGQIKNSIDLPALVVPPRIELGSKV